MRACALTAVFNSFVGHILSPSSGELVRLDTFVATQKSKRFDLNELIQLNELTARRLLSTEVVEPFI